MGRLASRCATMRCSCEEPSRPAARVAAGGSAVKNDADGSVGGGVAGRGSAVGAETITSGGDLLRRTALGRLLPLPGESDDEAVLLPSPPAVGELLPLALPGDVDRRALGLLSPRAPELG